MNLINYDFSNLEKIMFNLKSDQSSSRLLQLKNELNKFFKDSQCREVIYTNNNDKLFFGMCVIPMISGDQAVDILATDDKFRVSSYYIEIDSKLLSPLLGLSARELVATILHEIGHMVNNAEPVEEVRNAVSSYLAKTNDHLTITDAQQYREILAFAIKDSLRKVTSLFVREDEEIIADEFVVRCGFGPELESAYKRIVKFAGRLNKDVSNKLIVLQWTLRIYKDVKLRRIGALHTLNNAKKVTASVLQNREIDIVTRSLNQIDDEALIKEAVDLFRRTNDVFKSLKYRGMRSLEDELYEINLRVKNVDDQQEALSIIRQINIRLAIIDDYIKTERLSESELERWSDLMNKYRMVRDDLAKKTTYQDKYLGLFVYTPEVKSSRMQL